MSNKIPKKEHDYELQMKMIKLLGKISSYPYLTQLTGRIHSEITGDDFDFSSHNLLIKSVLSRLESIDAEWIDILSGRVRKD